MKRRGFNLLTTLSLAALFATIFLWVRGYFVLDSIGGDFTNSSNVMVGHWGVDAAYRRVGVWYVWQEPFNYRPASLLRYSTIPKAKVDSGAARHFFLGFAWGRPNAIWRAPKGPLLHIRHYIVLIPDWALVMAFAMLPSIWVWRRWRERQRHQIGHCRSCGYDLRGSPERCPECGTTPGSVQLGT